MSELWRRCLERLEGELSAEDMHTYLMPLQAGEDDEGLRLLAPNAYTLDFVKAEFLPRIGKVVDVQPLNIPLFAVLIMAYSMGRYTEGRAAPISWQRWRSTSSRRRTASRARSRSKRP